MSIFSGFKVPIGVSSAHWSKNDARKVSRMGRRTRPLAACLASHNLRGYCGAGQGCLETPHRFEPRSPAMTAIFRPEGPLFRATEHAGGPWSPEMLQGSATTAL